ncbi:beta,beta-carotene 15,15'-dioxygenase-like [Lytechinus variegatus]|uniref:beta,beta-carotene 15,15'-dioxygenase-like n=1 Tax=Lytechinus variegatus TaxID=7654 RepID=UPI001BB26B57|nr:beta,beta-carotene 15,15'-dioxygenase-like [Lytechinus variegatus]
MANSDPNFGCLFTSVQREYPTPVAAQVKGKLPGWLRGSLVRIGPGLFEVGETEYKHWFDGLALMHRFAFRDGKVSYQNRFLRSNAYKKAMKYNKIILSEFGTVGIPDPCKNVLERFATHFLPLNVTDNNLINVYQLGDEVYTATETHTPRKINLEDLSTEDQTIDLLKMFGMMTASAHAQVDRDGCSYNMGTSYLTGCYYNIIKFFPKSYSESSSLSSSPSSTSLENNSTLTSESSTDRSSPMSAKLLCSIRARNPLKPSYFHSFGMTDNYIVFSEQTLNINVAKLATSQMLGKPVSSCFEFDHNGTTLFHLVDKQTGEQMTTRYESGPLFGMHVINSYEEDDHVIFDICSYDDDELLKKFYLDYLRHGDQDGKRHFPITEVRRFVLPLRINKSTPVGTNLVTLNYTSASAQLRPDGVVELTYEVASDIGIDMPCINGRVNGRPYTYAYGTSGKCKGDFMNTIVKTNMRTKSCKTWHRPNHYPSEPIFVGAPDALDEDEGVLVSTVISSETQRAFLLVLDAKTLEEIARADIPETMSCPITFHGGFFH